MSIPLCSVSPLSEIIKNYKFVFSVFHVFWLPGRRLKSELRKPFEAQTSALTEQKWYAEIELPVEVKRLLPNEH